MGQKEGEENKGQGRRTEDGGQNTKDNEQRTKASDRGRMLLRTEDATCLSPRPEPAASCSRVPPGPHPPPLPCGAALCFCITAVHPARMAASKYNKYKSYVKNQLPPVQENFV